MWLAILALGLGGRAGGCLRRDSCFTGVSSWSPEKAAGFLGGSSRTGLAEGSWDRRAPDSLAEGLSSDTEGTTTRHTGDITQTQRRWGPAGAHRTGTWASNTAEHPLHVVTDTRSVKQ